MKISELLQPEVQEFIASHLESNASELALKKNPFLSLDYIQIINQIIAKQKAKEKLPTWFAAQNIIYPSKISVEQTSSEKTAAYKASLVSGDSLIDLTGGFGVDCLYFAKFIKKVTHCEIDEELSTIVSHNFKQLRKDNINCIAGDSFEILSNHKDKIDWIYIDPSRRNDLKGKVFMLKDCLPNVPELLSFYFTKSDHILIKTAPILDISAGLSELYKVKRIHIVALDNEVKELLLHWEKANEGTPRMISVVDLESGFSPFEFEPRDEERAHSQFAEAGNYLIEPLAGILKAGAFTLFGARFGLKKLERNSHLYTSETFTTGIPGRVFEVIQEISPKKQEIKTFFPSGKVNVICRNYVTGAEELKKKLGVKDGGEDYLIGTQTATGFKLYWCKRVQ